jgi:hypothetical protein
LDHFGLPVNNKCRTLKQPFTSKSRKTVWPEARLVPIPEEFRSVDSGALFQRCLICDRALLAGDTEYLVEKAVRKYPPYDVQDTVFEYAMCVGCHESISSTLSSDSRERVENFFLNRVNYVERAVELGQTRNVFDWVSRCLVTGVAVSQLKEYQIVAHCVGDHMVLSHAPFLVSGEAMDEISALLSKKTQDELGGFRDKYFGMPPELQPQLLVM